MRQTFLLVFATLLASFAQAQQTPSSVALGAGRPETPGITRTTVRDDAKASVIKVHFAPGAKEVPHTHPYDIVVVAVATGKATFVIGDKTTESLNAGDVQLVPQGVVHYLANHDSKPFEVVTVAVK